MRREANQYELSKNQRIDFGREWKGGKTPHTRPFGVAAHPLSFYAALTQLAEYWFSKPNVAGSNPVCRNKKGKYYESKSKRSNVRR